MKFSFDPNAADKITALDKLKFYQTVLRQTHRILTGDEKELMIVLTDAIVGWGVWSATLTDEELLIGHPDRLSGLTFSPRQIKACRKALVEKGLITTERTRDGMKYTIIEDTSEWTNVYKLPTPKKTRNRTAPVRENTLGWHGDEEEADPKVQEVPFNGAGDALHRGTPCTLRENKNTETNNETIPAAPPQSGRGQELAERLVAEVKSKSDDRAEKRISQTSVADIFTISKTWRDAHIDAYGIGVCRERLFIEWSNATKGAIKTFVRKWPKPDAEGEAAWGDFHDFIEYAVKNWTNIVSARLGWMDTRPQWPEPRFLIRFHEEFLASWCEQRLKRFISNDAKDRVEQLQAGGMNYEDAMAEVRITAAVAEHAERFDKERAEIARLHRVLDVREKELDRRPTWSADNPHPKAAPPRIKPPSMRSK